MSAVCGQAASLPLTFTRPRPLYTFKLVMKNPALIVILLVVCMHKFAEGMAKADPGELEDALNAVLEQSDSTLGKC